MRAKRGFWGRTVDLVDSVIESLWCYILNIRHFRPGPVVGFVNLPHYRTIPGIHYPATHMCADEVRGQALDVCRWLLMHDLICGSINYNQ